MYYLTLRTASIVIICYILQVTTLAFKDISREVAIERGQRPSRDQRDFRDSREARDPRDNRERDPRESRDQRDDDRERDRDDRDDRERGEPEDERDIKDRKDSKEVREPKEIKESKDFRDTRDYRDSKGKKEMTTPDVDEFLEKILKSDKIKQIADLIAEKAADKILSESKTRDAFRSGGKEKGDENESLEKDKHADEFDDDEALRKGKVPKIDAKAAMKKVSKFPDDDVSLNYKHFIADSVVTKESNANKHRSERLDEARDGADENRDKYDKNSNKKPDLRSNPKFRESGEIESGEHKRHEKRPLRLEADQRGGKKRPGKQRAFSDETFESAERVTPKETELVANSKEEEMLINEFSKALKPNEPAKSLKKVQRAAKSFSNNYTATYNSDSDSNKVPIADVHSHDLPSRSLIREEGGKLYAYSPSRDYDEYHEKLSSLLKSVQDKTIRKLEKQTGYKEI